MLTLLENTKLISNNTDAIETDKRIDFDLKSIIVFPLYIWN